ncbi:MAG: PAS domain-containing sensor histidine kinase [Cellulosilyticaceae bacterium]
MKYTVQHLEQLLDMTPQSVDLKDSEGRYTYFNPAFKETMSNIMGYECDEILGKKSHEIFTKISKEYSIFLEKNKIYIYELNIKDRKIIMEVKEVPLIEDETNVGGTAEILSISHEELVAKGIIEDGFKEITEIYTWNQQNERLDIKYKDVENIIDEFFMALQCDYLSIYRYDKEKGLLEKYITRGLDEYQESMKKEEDIDLKRLEASFRNKEKNYMNHISEISEYKGYKKDFQERGIAYWGAYPVQFNEQIWGIVNVGYKGNNKRPYFKNTYVDDLCRKIVSIIKNEYLIERIFKEIDLEEQIVRERELFFETATDFLCILDEKQKVRRINRVWAENLGYTKESIKGKEIYEYIYEEDRVESRAVIKEQFQGKKIKGFINRYQMEDGSLRWILWRGKSVSIKDKKIIIGVGKDINKHKQVEEKRLELKKNLEREKYKNLFFSTISHEFKTPLNIILSITQLIGDNCIEENSSGIEDKFNKYINFIDRNAYTTLKVANNLIDLMKMDTRIEKLNYNYYNIVEVIEEITIAVAKYTQNKGVNITFDTEIEEQVIWCDEKAIERIMLNLLSNAIKHSPVGGNVLVYIKPWEGNIRISIEDQGAGLTDMGDGVDIGQVIWHNENKGLGLRIVDQLVNLHKGKLIIENQKAVGMKVTFVLPILEGEYEGEIIYRGDLSDRHRESCKQELCDI